MTFSLMARSALNTIKRATSLNAVVFVRHRADRTSRVEISPTSLEAATRKISSRIYLAAAVVVVRAKVKIYKLKQQLPLKKLLLGQL